jgi:hypothetical protein
MSRDRVFPHLRATFEMLWIVRVEKHEAVEPIVEFRYSRPDEMVQVEGCGAVRDRFVSSGTLSRTV